MADKALQKLEDQLNCAICLDTYKDPKLLQCFHVFCRQCLVKLVLRDQQGLLILNCPTCRQVTPIPANGVAGLQSAFYINQLLEIVEEQKKTGINTAKVEETATDSIATCCPDHDGREMELYCDTCEKTICFKCVIKDEKHHNHKYEELSKAFERCTGEVATLLEPLEKQLNTVGRALDLLKVQENEVSEQQTVIESDIHSSIERLQNFLDVRKAELVSQLHQMTEAKLKSLEMQGAKLETTQAQLSNCLHTLKRSFKTDNQGEVLLYVTVKHAKELATTFQPDTLKPSTEADIVFLPSTGLATECQNYGRLSVVHPSKCYAFLNNFVSVGEESSAYLRTLSANEGATHLHHLRACV